MPLAEQWLAQGEKPAVHRLCQSITYQTTRGEAHGFSATQLCGSTSLANLDIRANEKAPKTFLSARPTYPPMDVRHRLQAARELLEQKTQLPAADIGTVQAVYTQTVHDEIKKSIDETVTIIQSLYPPPCAFSFLGLGSIARRTMCPGSDLDLGLLIAEEPYRADPFFHALIHALQMHLATQVRRD